MAITSTLLETNSEFTPEKWVVGRWISFWGQKPLFHGRAVSFREGKRWATKAKSQSYPPKMYDDFAKSAFAHEMFLLNLYFFWIRFLILPVTLHKCLLGFQLQLGKSSQEVSTETARLNALLGVKDAQIVWSLRWTFLEVSHEQVDHGNTCHEIRPTIQSAIQPVVLPRGLYYPGWNTTQFCRDDYHKPWNKDPFMNQAGFHGMSAKGLERCSLDMTSVWSWS